ncbi:unnamed protein product [Owenia fusiformis]|uniref:L-seryl-tRNA(Sec) kinase n=1 Tax=Owenia fusiformis TaxID=6347 RepID=A0A8S4NMR8_OWEFU|nr:unnamed protein product [Owenia fusiformis]
MDEHSKSDEIKFGLVVLCGIPGSGKSTLANGLKNYLREASDKTHAIHICYDELFPSDLEREIITQSQYNSDEGEGISKWKSYRKAIFNSVEGLIGKVMLKQVNPNTDDIESEEDRLLFETIQRTIHKKYDEIFSGIRTDVNNVVLIIDDNMYYRSMRYSYFQLAKKYSTGFVQFYIKCPTDLALERNHARGEPVDKDIILTMDTRLEPPNPELNKWEENSYVIDSMETDMNARFSFVIDKIEHCLKNPIPLEIEENVEEKEESRVICSKNTLHQIDQILRKIVQDHMKHSARNAANMAEQGKIANATRSYIFSHFKLGKLTLASMDDVTDSSKDKNSTLYKHVSELFKAEINKYKQ